MSPSRLHLDFKSQLQGCNAWHYIIPAAHCAKSCGCVLQTEDNADEASSDSEDFELGSEDEGEVLGFCLDSATMLVCNIAYFAVVGFAEDDEEDLIEQFVAQKHITGDGSMDV